MSENEATKKYLSVNVDKSIISKLKTYSATQGVMRYSGITEELLSLACKKADSIEKYSELKDIFSEKLTGFINIKKGRPLKNIKIPKGRLTLYLDNAILKNIYETSKKYQLSISGSVEMLLRIVL